MSFFGEVVEEASPSERRFCLVGMVWTGVSASLCVRGRGRNGGRCTVMPGRDRGAVRQLETAVWS